MRQHADISWDALLRLFSVVICVDESMVITDASATALKFMPELAGSPALADVFDVVRPNSLDFFEHAPESLCLMTAKSGRFAIRGQLLWARQNDREVIFFCGSPWLFWINSNCPDLQLGLGDFSNQDVQLDQLFFMSTEKRMVADLEKLNRDLEAAKTELERTHDAQRRFFAQMSHEMRTPLNGVVSALSLLDTAKLDDKQAQLISLAQSSSHNLMQVIDYVLDVSKLELLQEEEDVDFNCPEFLQSTMDIVRAKAQEKSLELNLELAPDLRQVSRGCPSLLRQSLLNLLFNAIKFTNSGSVTLRVSRGHRDDSQFNQRFEVIDTGIGIADAEQQRIFDPFYSLTPQGSAQDAVGTGLGLDIVRRNVARMGGSMGLESAPGKGSTFWFELPMAAPPATGTAQLEPIPTETPAREIALSGSVLLVDDNQTNLVLGTMILESLGLEVTSAADGAEALRKAGQQAFDLVLMDLTMPGMDGLEATRQIRGFADSRILPIVALTAHADTRERNACRAAGMNGYLTKPIVPEAMAAELARWLGGNDADKAGNGNDRSHQENSAPDTRIELVDASVLQELSRQIGRDNLETVVNKVRVESAQRWNELVNALGSGEAKEVQRHVHSLGSIFSSVGLIPAGEAFAAIESALRAGDQPPSGWVEEVEILNRDSMVALDRSMTEL